LQQVHELEHAYSLTEDVHGSLSELEAVGAYGKLGHVSFLQLVHRGTDELRDLLTGVSFFLRQVVIDDVNELIELRSEVLDVVSDGTLLLEVAVVERAQTET
jgi:hypothetical protein